MTDRSLHGGAHLRQAAYILALAVSLIILTVPAAGQVYAAGSGSCGDGVQWTYDSGTLTISGSGDITSADYLDSYQKQITKVVIEDGVTGICDCAFAECVNLADVEIPGSVRTIGMDAFDSCAKLTAIDLPEGIERIDSWAFFGCTGLTDVVIPSSIVNGGLNSAAFVACPNINSIVMAADNDYYKSPEGSNSIYAYRSYSNHNVLVAAGNNSVIPDEVDEIGTSVFDGRNITEIVIPEGVTYIHDYAFSGCKKLNRIVLPKSLAQVGFEAFFECSSLATVYYAGSEEDWSGIDISDEGGDDDNDALLEAERVYNTSQFEGEPAVSASGSYRIKPDGGDQIITVAWRYLNHVLTIESGSGVYTLGTIYYSGDDSEGIWTDSKYNIDRGQIEKIVINSGVRTVGERTFSSMDGLKEVVCMGRMEEIQKAAFQNSSLEQVTLKNGANSIEENAFRSPGAGYSLTVESGTIEKIEAGAFAGCQKAYFDGNVGTISGNIASFPPFSSCEEVEFGSNVTKIAAKLMYGDRFLTSVKMGDSVEEIGASAFQLTSSLTSIVLGSGVKTIGAGAFRDSGLEEIMLPEALTIVGEDAFNGCSSLKAIFYAGGKDDWDKIAIGSGNAALNKDNVFFHSTSRVQAAEQKIYAIGTVTLDSEAAILSAREFFDALSEEEQQQVSQDAKDTLTNAEETLADLKAFAAMEGVSFTDGVLTVSKDIEDAEMPWSSFADDIEKAIFAAGVTKVPDKAFYNADHLKEVELADTVTRIGSFAFAYSDDLRQVRMPGVTQIDACAFYDTDLESVQLPDNLAVIGDSAFARTRVREVSIPASVKTIGAEAFGHCHSLIRVYIAKGVESIGGSAFAGWLLREDSGQDIHCILYAGSEADWNEVEGHEFVGGSYGNDIHVYFNVNTLAELLEQRINALVKTGYSSASEDSEETEALNNELNTLAATYDSRFGAMTPEERASMTPSCKQDFEKLLRDVWHYDYFVVNNDYLNYSREDFSESYSDYDSTTDENWTSTDMELVNGTLTIHKGAVLDWTENPAPWSLVSTGGYYRDDALYAIERIVIEDGVTSIGPYAFAGCMYLKEVQLPAGMKSIGDFAFAGCTDLRDLNIPASVEKIGKYAFDGCYMLKRIYYGGDKIAWNVAAADSTGKGTVIDNTRSGNYDLINAYVYENCNSRMDYVLKQLKYFKNNNVTKNNLYEAQSLKAVVEKLSDEDWNSIPDDLQDAYYEMNEGIEDPQPEDVAVKPVVKLSKSSFIYSGKAQKPSVTVTVNGNNVSSKYYSVSYPSGCKNVGSYEVTVTMKKGYAGSGSATFKIVPMGTTVSKVTAAKKTLTVKWKKQASQTTGYEIQYSTSSKFGAGTKTVRITKNKTVSKKINKLKAKKKYFVRIRTYKKVSGKYYYSSWSKAKSMKTK